MADQTPPSLISKMQKFFPMAEGVFLAAFAVGLVLQYFDIQSKIVFIALMGLSTVYFLGAYVPMEFPSDNKQGGFVDLFSKAIAPKLLSIACSVCVVGILFYLTALKGAKQMLLIGAFTVALSSIILFLIIFKNEAVKKALMPLLLRAVPLAIVSFYILFNESLKN
jgi:hypothetical protein